MPNHKLSSTVYPNLVGSPDDTRLNPHVSAHDCRTIVSVTGSTQILSHICQLAIKTTADYVRNNSVDFTTSERLHDFLRQRSSSAVNATETDERNDAGRDSGGGESVADTSRGKSVSRKGVAGKRSGEKGKGK